MTMPYPDPPHTLPLPVFCGCNRYRCLRGASCGNLATQEDLLCDTCRVCIAQMHGHCHVHGVDLTPACYVYYPLASEQWIWQ